MENFETVMKRRTGWNKQSAQWLAAMYRVRKELGLTQAQMARTAKIAGDVRNEAR